DGRSHQPHQHGNLGLQPVCVVLRPASAGAMFDSSTSWWAWAIGATLAAFFFVAYPAKQIWNLFTTGYAYFYGRLGTAVKIRVDRRWHSVSFWLYVALFSLAICGGLFAICAVPHPP